MTDQSTAGDGQPDTLFNQTGAAAALAGYDYQVDISIFAAIRLMLISKSATRITLEPANQDDLEADLVPHRPGRVEPRAQLADGYRLVIQVKRDTGEPWSIADFEALLNHGKRRKPARTHLDDPKVHYLLVTTAATKGVAMDLEVEDFEEAADKASFPASLVGTLRADAAGRVAIWAGLTGTLLALKLRETITDLLHVPSTRQDELLAALRTSPYVDRIFYTAFDVHPLAGLAVVIGAVALVMSAAIGALRGASERPALLAFGGCWLGVVVAAALDNYPTPLVGYGGSAVLGYLLSVALLPNSARETSLSIASRSHPLDGRSLDRTDLKLRIAGLVEV